MHVASKFLTGCVWLTVEVEMRVGPRPAAEKMSRDSARNAQTAVKSCFL